MNCRNTILDIYCLNLGASNKLRYSPINLLKIFDTQCDK